MNLTSHAKKLRFRFWRLKQDALALREDVGAPSWTLSIMPPSGEGRGVKDCGIIHNSSFSEKNFRGYLTPWDDLVPFQTTRVNCTYGVPDGVERGGHAHQIVHELCVVMMGSMTVVVEDHTGSKEMKISSPTEGAYIAPGTWITLKDFAPATCLLILCSGDFDPAEVIRTRAAFDAHMAFYIRGEVPPPYARTMAVVPSSIPNLPPPPPPSAVEDEFIQVNTPLLCHNEKKYVLECVETGWISSEGAFVQRFEKEMASYCGRRYAVAVTNGTAALDIAVDALGIGAGDEVIMPTFTIISCITQIARCGAIPVVVDCDDSFNMDVSQIEALITPRTKAIMAVHIYHFPCDMHAIVALAKKHNLHVIEDAAELIGASCRGRKVGSFGDVSTMSFYPNKHVTTGEGGMVLTDDEKLYRRIAERRNLCFEPPRRFVHVCARQSNLTAAADHDAPLIQTPNQNCP